MNASMNKQDGRQIHITKKCPECLGRVPLDMKICEFCKTKLGDVDKGGLATRPVNWKSYIVFFLTLAGLGLYIWWAFLKDTS